MDTFDLDVRNQNMLISALDKADNLLMKKYLPNLSDFEIMPLSDEISKSNVSSFTRLYKIDSIAYEKDQNNQDKLLNVYNALYSGKGSLVLIIDSDPEGVEFYIGTKSMKGSVSACQAILSKALKGNFPGTKITSLKNPEIETVIENLYDTGFENVKKSISSVSGISTFRTERDMKNTGFVQGIEKIVDAMRGEKYSIVIIADPISQTKIDTIRNGYESLYTQLVPFASTDLNFSANESSGVTDSLTKGISSGISESLSKTHTFSEGNTKTRNDTKQTGKTSGVAFFFNVGTSTSKSLTEGSSENWSKSDAEAKISGETNTTSEQTSTSKAFTDGRGRSLQIKMENKSVKVLLEKIDDQLKRLNECNDLGMWNCSTYVIADDMQTSTVLASAYQALMRGKDSGAENAAINTWTDNNKLDQVSGYLKKLQHPLVVIEPGNPSLPLVTPGSLVSGGELTIAAGLPQKSIPGLSVSKFTAFGREVLPYFKEDSISIKLGKINHMGQDENINVKLDLQSLAAHTFITGSTGSGKSNTIYKLLDELNKKGINFLVIEPAKGEYKNIFGERTDVTVLGTNFKRTKLLRINPFRFPRDIHVLEHIDRLIEIFNVCWPMYAAMPAVLKDAIEKAYINAGWDLDLSENTVGAELFPSFTDVLLELYNVINTSEFSAEVKSNYIGALVTRIKSLTNGINGRIFVNDETDNNILFESNVIVDLSRVASVETKAMIMGILVMRLQEHRISIGGMNKPLKHITVLEEAHNLLKRTSTEQTGEGSNLLGKSVEMIANSIAEMRTYGEGFIIADQSPSMLDMSVIRNTNTKIILRLPDMSDRELVGKAANLNDDQIVEIARLSTGVASIYQNNWLEPVLCHIDRFETDEKEYVFKDLSHTNNITLIKREIIRALLAHIVKDKIDYNIDALSDKIIKSSLSTSIKLETIALLHKNDRHEIKMVSSIIYRLINTEKMFENAKAAETVEQWNELIIKNADDIFEDMESYYQNVMLQCLIKEKSSEDKSLEEMYPKWTEYMRGKLV